MIGEILMDATLEDLAALPASGPVSLILRHSERENITGDGNVFTAGLTIEGIAAARFFGSEVARQRRLMRLVSSPVSRCVDTAVAIAKGAGYPEKVRVDDRLSHLNLLPVWNALPHCCEFDSMPAGLVSLIELLLPQSDEEDGLEIFVTHDTVVASLAGYLTGEPVQGDATPRFLEGVFVWKVGGDVYFQWRGMTVAIDADHRF